MRVLNANFRTSPRGVFTTRPEALTNDFFVNLLDMRTEWNAVSDAKDGVRRARSHDGPGQVDRTRVDLIFGSHSQLRALAEVYASADASTKFVEDFVAAWNKVMNLDRLTSPDLKAQASDPSAAVADASARSKAGDRRGHDEDRRHDAEGGRPLETWRLPRAYPVPIHVPSRPARWP